MKKITTILLSLFFVFIFVAIGLAQQKPKRRTLGEIKILESAKWAEVKNLRLSIASHRARIAFLQLERQVLKFEGESIERKNAKKISDLKKMAAGKIKAEKERKAKLKETMDAKALIDAAKDSMKGAGSND